MIQKILKYQVQNKKERKKKECITNKTKGNKMLDC